MSPEMSQFVLASAVESVAVSSAAAGLSGADGYGGGSLDDVLLRDLRIRPADVSLPPAGSTGRFDAAQAMPAHVRRAFLSPSTTFLPDPPPPPLPSLYPSRQLL